MSNNYHYSQNQLHGDIIGGDKVYGDVTNSKIFPVSKGILSEAAYGGSQENFERMYRSVFLAIEKRPEDSRVKKGELNHIADNIYKELLQESTANLSSVRQWLKQLNSLAPDVYQTSIAVLTNPSNGLSEATRANLDSLREECQPIEEMTMPINAYLENELTTNQKSSAVSQQMRGELEELQHAVTEGNVKPVRQILVDMTNELPGMKLPLRHWLVDSNGIPTAIKVFARNYLDSL
jgi:hypothetical protein